MTINNANVEQINVALLDLDKRIKALNIDNEAIKSLQNSVKTIKSSLNEAQAGLKSGETYDINISGNASTATNANHAETATIAETATNANHAETAETATKVANALTINGKTYNGSSAVDAGVQTVANGGTGVTTQADINKAFIGNLDTGESDVTDGTEFVSSWANDNGFSEPEALNKPYRRKFSAVWGYIKGKISSVLGLTKDNYGGKADKAVEVVDYADSSKTVKIGYEGPGLTADKLLHLAGYTRDNSNFIKLKDVDDIELIKWLGIPRIKYADYQIPAQTFTQFQQVPIELSNFSSEVTPNNILCFMVIYWTGVQLIASGDWGSAALSDLKCALIALQAGTGSAIIRCVYMV